MAEELTKEQKDICYEVMFALIRAITKFDLNKLWVLIREAILSERTGIVRCKDCKYFKTYPPTEDQDYTIYDCERLNYCTDNAVGNRPEDFCSRGERHDS